MIYGPHTKTKSILTTHTKTESINPHTKSESFSDRTQKPSYFKSHPWNRVNFDPHFNIKSISMPRHKNRVNFDPDTKKKSLSTATQNQVNSDTYNEIKSISIPTLKKIYFDAPRHKNQVNFIQTLSKPSHLRPPHKTNSFPIHPLESS